jgi:hypothetical protein
MKTRLFSHESQTKLLYYTTIKKNQNIILKKKKNQNISIHLFAYI